MRLRWLPWAGVNFSRIITELPERVYELASLLMFFTWSTDGLENFIYFFERPGLFWAPGYDLWLSETLFLLVLFTVSADG